MMGDESSMLPPLIAGQHGPGAQVLTGRRRAARFGGRIEQRNELAVHDAQHRVRRNQRARSKMSSRER